MQAFGHGRSTITAIRLRALTHYWQWLLDGMNALSVWPGAATDPKSMASKYLGELASLCLQSLELAVNGGLF